MALEVDTIILPAHWACALVNGDTTGMSDYEERVMDRYINRRLEPDGWYVVSTVNDEEEWFTWRYRLYGGDAEGGSVLTYVIHRQVDEEVA